MVLIGPIKGGGGYQGFIKVLDGTFASCLFFLSVFIDFG